MKRFNYFLFMVYLVILIFPVVCAFLTLVYAFLTLGHLYAK
jgi:hypothetical protein